MTELPVASSRKFTLTQIIARMNWIAQQSAPARESLRDKCHESGHVATGERVMVNPPIDTCYRCGAEFSL